MKRHHWGLLGVAFLAIAVVRLLWGNGILA
jgi:hypothetical protein